MITPIWMIKTAAWFLETALPFLVKYWKQLIVGGMAVWIVVCCFTHCSGNRQPQTIHTEHRDTTFVVDTTWHAMLGDTIAYYEQKLLERKWERPSVELAEAASVEDSLSEYRTAFEWALHTIDDCDSTYRADYAVRSYLDSTETDSFKLKYHLKLKGKLLEKPRFWVNNKIPAATITITKFVPVGPYRSIYVGTGFGPSLYAGDNKFRAMEFELETGYMDKKNWQYGIAAEYATANDYAVKFRLRRNFNFGK